MFSCIFKYLNKFNAWTVKSLISSVKASYTTITPNVVELEHVLDMQDFYEEHLPTAGSLNNISTFDSTRMPPVKSSRASHVGCGRTPPRLLRVIFFKAHRNRSPGPNLEDTYFTPLMETGTLTNCTTISRRSSRACRRGFSSPEKLFKNGKAPSPGSKI